MHTSQRLATAVAALGDEAVAPPVGTRVGAALVLLRDLTDGDAEIVYTRRRDDLRSHPGQISFPGGRVDPGETIAQAAVREAHEEVGLDPSTVTVLGSLPAFYIPPSRFWLQPVLARWDAPHPLVAAEAEVAAVLHVPLSLLRDPSVWRGVRLSTSGWTWAWELGGDHLLWGATGMVTAFLLNLLGDWTGGVSPGDLPPERHVQPWNRILRAAPVRLLDVDEARPEDLPVTSAGPPDLAGARCAGAALADAVLRLRDRPSPLQVAVLCGSGWTGAAGLAAAVALRHAGVEVDVVLGGSDGPPPGSEGLDGAQEFDGDLPHAPVVLDALLGRGLDGPLRDRPLAVAHRLRAWVPTIVAVDLPSGLHPDTGLLGDLVPADVTVSLGPPAPSLFAPGLTPFVGDLYLAGLTSDPPPLYRLVSQGA